MARTRYLSELRQDVGYAARLLRRAPGFTAVAVLTLAVGIGGSTTIFTVVDSVLLRPLRFAEPERLTMLWATLPPARCCARLSERYLYEWRQARTAFHDIAVWSDERVSITGQGTPVEASADKATTNFFDVLGTPALIGRTFTVDPTLRETQPEVVLSYGFWQRHYGARPDAIGRSITVNGEPSTIIGVMPEDFAIRTVELAESRAELWLASALLPSDRVGMGGHYFGVGRLASGVTIEQAHAQLALIARRLEDAHPSYSRDWDVGVVPLHDATVKDVRGVLVVLFAAVSLLLLIACANVANLGLNRAAARQTELAIRVSLGATGRRLARQLMTESLVLSAVGGVLGVTIAQWGTTLMVWAVPPSLQLPRAREIHLDWRVLAFAGLVTLVTALLVGVAPLLARIRSVPQAVLQRVARGGTPGPHRRWLNATLAIAEVALAVVLLAGAGLLARSFWALTRVNPGFDPAQVLTLSTRLPSPKYESEERRRAFTRELLDRIAALPAARAVGSVGYLPMTNTGAGGPFEIEGQPAASPAEQRGSWISIVGGGYYEAMGIPLLRGRLPSDADTEHTTPVFVIDEELARRYWPNEDPIGARLVWRRGQGQQLSGEVIGVVGSVRWNSLAANPNGTTYFWYPQDPTPEITVVVRALGDPAAIAGDVAAQVAAIDANQPVGAIRLLRDVVAGDLARPRFTMLLLGGFAATALVLAALGLYGVIAFGVTERTREIGVRVALGAQRRDVLRLVMLQGVLLTGVGLAIGIAIAMAGGRLVASLLYGVTPTDPATLVGVACFLAFVAMLATFLPAHRAARVDPMVALRTE